jgi:predicted transcriptional regulator
MNYLKAVFWDYPELTNEEALASLLKENANSKKKIKTVMHRRYKEKCLSRLSHIQLLKRSFS